MKLRSNPSRLQSADKRQPAAASWRSGKDSSAARGYGHDWRIARADYLQRNPLCTMCYQVGHVTPATVVDHVLPHNGDNDLFWNEANWQPLCKSCHSAHKQRQERHAAAGSNVLGHGRAPSRR